MNVQYALFICSVLYSSYTMPSSCFLPVNAAAHHNQSKGLFASILMLHFNPCHDNTTQARQSNRSVPNFLISSVLYIYMYVHLRTYVHTYVYMSINIRSSVWGQCHAQTHACVHTHTHTHTHTHAVAVVK